MQRDEKGTSCVCLYLLGKTRALLRVNGAQKELRIQPKPLYMLSYLALNWNQPHRREMLQALFWPDKPSRAAANNLRQALWHLRQAIPSGILRLPQGMVRWSPDSPPWVDALAFESALDADDLDAALDLYGGPLLPEVYDEWVELERERLHLRYLVALEARAHRHYEARRYGAALADAENLIAADPLNEAAVCLVMACYWAVGQREAARHCYDISHQRIRRELGSDPLPKTTALYQRILRGEAHPDQLHALTDASVAAQEAHLSLLETLGAFRQGLEQATDWATSAKGQSLAAARRWQGRFHLRLGRLNEARTALSEALPLAATVDLEAAILADLATTETGLGNFATAEAHYARALHLSSSGVVNRIRMLSSRGGLLGRMGRFDEARRTLDEAVRLARDQGEPAFLAYASGSLGILLMNQGEAEAAEMALGEALQAAQQAGAHWLTAHCTGHLGVLAQDRHHLEKAARYYERARTLTETFADQRGATLWTLNLGVVYYEQGQVDQALELLIQGRQQAAEQGSRSLEAGGTIFIGACLMAQGKAADGLTSIEQGLALAEAIGDHERILIGLLHKGRALAALGRSEQARAALQQGLHQIQARGRTHRLEDYLRAELDKLPPQ
jgi:DNA-binding SARP family transcriptional activator/Tfp pilus assembly protein PilF